MKPFNLEEALKGAPVRLRNGCKAYVLCDVGKLFAMEENSYPLYGIHSQISDSNEFCADERWRHNGKNGDDDCNHPYDIISMWEEPELTQEQILEKAYQENLKVAFDRAMFTNGYEVIAKTKDGKYILRNGSSHLTQAHEDMTNFRIYEEKPSTVTVTLPKPFTPIIGEEYWYLESALDKKLFVQKGLHEKGHYIINDGNYFRTREDAQKWIDAMKGALDE